MIKTMLTCYNPHNTLLSISNNLSYKQIFSILKDRYIKLNTFNYLNCDI